MSQAPPDPRGLLVDTSVIRHWGSWGEICDLAEKAGLPVFVSTISHGELLRHLRVQHGPGFSREVLERNPHFALSRRLPVGDEVAEEFAEAVHRRHPSDEDWNRAKQKHCHRMLRITEKLPFEEVTTAEHCSATCDWFIAATAARNGLLMITQDTGPEFHICQTATMEQAKEMLERLLGAGG